MRRSNEMTKNRRAVHGGPSIFCLVLRTSDWADMCFDAVGGGERPEKRRRGCPPFIIGRKDEESWPDATQVRFGLYKKSARREHWRGEENNCEKIGKMLRTAKAYRDKL